MAVQQQAPTLREIAFCDGFHQEPHSSRFSILGRFESLELDRFPSDVRFGVYFAVGNEPGTHDIAVRLVDEQSRSVFEAAKRVTFEVPLTEGLMKVRAALPGPGVYRCELWCDDQLLGTSDLTVRQAPRKHRKSWFFSW